MPQIELSQVELEVKNIHQKYEISTKMQKVQKNAILKLKYLTYQLKLT